MLPSHLVCRERPNSKEKTKSRSIEEKSKEQSAEEVKKKKYILKKSKELSRSQEKSQDKTQEKSAENAKSKLSKEKMKGGSGVKSKEKNSSGYKRSSTSTGQSVMTSLNTDLFLEYLARTKEMKKKSIINTLVYLIFAIFLLYFGGRRFSKYQLNEGKNKILFAPVFPSVTHYKLSILSDDPIESITIRDQIMSFGENKNYHREAAIYHVYSFYEYLADHGYYTLPFLLQTSLMAMNFDGNPATGDLGPLIVHNQNLTQWNDEDGFDFYKSLAFSTLNNSLSIFSKDISYGFLRDIYGESDTDELDQLNNNETQDELRGNEEFFDPFHLIRKYDLGNLNGSNVQHYSTVDPRVSISSLPFLSSKKFGHLQFASSGPKTLGTIAEIAIHLALKRIRIIGKTPHPQLLDDIIASSLRCTLQTLVRQEGYLENIALYTTKIQYDLINKNACLRDTSNIKLHTNDVVTSNLLLMDNRDGWPTLMHYSVSSEGFVNFEFNGKNSTGLLNVCQVAVLKNGNLWLTAAASGEFYLLEKVVSSIVHKIVLNTDPLALLLFKNRRRYDTQSGTITKKEYSYDFDNNEKEILQFSAYNSEQNRFRSWVEGVSSNEIASGF